MGNGVKQETVFKAFKAKGVDFVKVPGSKHLVEVAGPDGQLTTECIPPELGRREPQRLADLFGIPIQWFYTPLMIPGDEDKGKPN
jgi:hypothetical protein